MTNKEAIGQLKWVQKRICDITYSPESFEALNLAIKALEDRPKGETQGAWIEQGYLEYTCSVCGRHISLEDHWTNITKDFPFCHCGAKMMGVKNETVN